MDVYFFLQQRTAFIRQFYNRAATPFLEIIRKIENEEEPYIPPYSEDGEPSFLAEWIEASESGQILGYSCISMLSAALHLFFKTWEGELRQPAFELTKSEFKKTGWFGGYKAYFEVYAGIKFADGPANLILLEEIVLARNAAQHPKDIFNQIAFHPTAGQNGQAFFMSDREKELFTNPDASEERWLLPARLHVSGETLESAISEVEKFCEWLDAELISRLYRR